MWTSTYYNYWDYWSLYHKVTFDGDNKLILINPGETYIDVESDLYSDWKEWIRLYDYTKYPVAISSIGGEPIGGGQFVGATFFLENGWRIRPQEETATIEFVGNLYTREEGGSPIVSTIGKWNTNITFTRSTLVFKVESETTNTGSIPTADQIAEAVWNKLIPSIPTTGSYGEHVAGRLLTIAHYLGMK
jgi:hypothetical protein